MIRCNSIIGCAIVILLVNTAARGEFVRVALVSPGGAARGSKQAIDSGDVVGTFTQLSDTMFNALEVSTVARQLRRAGIRMGLTINRECGLQHENRTLPFLRWRRHL